ncbi:Invasion associated locus B [Paraglaciecola sp. T6c]|uniref:invasion associated locus B family protein n=1 Tax=Pseudoalteromonas atlantica (strain T6c / ATCC BAA-1087) TaxID=3042615 RepID=UPI00005C5A64|nr:invasion associated locus B family protein [Paraglaciecola sp. T6c]ABG42763.1 Invasion associated locus B [Paraglaciecola sp. T6c]
MRFIFAFFILGISISSAVQAQSKQNFGSWSLLCGEHGNCSVSQLVAMDPEGTKVLLGANINFSMSNSFPVLMLRMPPNLNKSSGVGIKIDDNNAIQVALSQCTSVACQSVIKIDKTLFAEMRGGRVAKVAFALEKSKQLTLPLSLEGFADAYAALLATRKAS